MTEQHEGNPQDVQDQITDIIVNEYEADHRYSRKELRRILDSIVDVIDQHVGHKVYAGPGHIDSRESEVEVALRQKHSRPMISAEIHSDDYRSEAKFQANRWLTAATDAEIKALAAVDWGGDLEADAVAYFMEPLDLGVERVLEYSRTAIQMLGDRMGFEVRVDETEARAWLTIHRPELFREMTEV